MFNLNQWPIIWAIIAPIQIKPVHSSLSYQQATYQKYGRCGHKSPSGYGPLLILKLNYVFIPNCMIYIVR